MSDSTLGTKHFNCVIFHCYSDFPVYHTAFDSYSWMANFGDPLFQRHVAGSLLMLLYLYFYTINKVQGRFLVSLLKLPKYPYAKKIKKTQSADSNR